MDLTPAQKTVIANDIRNNPTLFNQPFNSDGYQFIADFYNALAAPDYWVWRTAVSKAEYVQQTSAEGTIFSWTGTGFITRSQGERDAWHELFNSNETANPSLSQVRQAFTDIFSGGTAPAPANRTHLATVSRRKADVIEKLLASGGNGSTATPSTMGAEGTLIPSQVQDVRENY